MNQRVLFAWELGANYGHLSRDLPVALSLRALGCAATFAVRDTRVAAELLSRARLPFLQAPHLSSRVRMARPPACYAEMLIADGYADPTALAGAVQAWLSLFDLVKPDCVVIDHAPTACLASHFAGLPAVHLGSGFEIPPALHPLPSIRPWETVAPQRLARAEQAVLDSVAKVAGSGGWQPLDRLGDLFAPSRAAIASFPELDHYGARAAAHYVGPIHFLPRAPQMAWAAQTRRRLFAYLRPSLPGFEALLAALSRCDAEVICVVPGATPALCEQFGQGGLRLLPHAVDLERLLPQADLAVTYGTMGTATPALLAGVPTLLVPQNVEQYLLSRRVEALGAGLLVDQARTEEGFSAALRRLLNEAGYREAARAFSARHRGFHPRQAIERAAAMVANTLVAARTDGAQPILN